MAEPQAVPAGKPDRPLSPHLQIYRFTWTMVMSIVHRITGVGLYFGTLLLVAWLIAAASGPDAYQAVRALYGSWLGLVILFGYTWALFHHMLGGVRHFLWDFGIGMERKERFFLSKATLAGSVLLTIVVWAVALYGFAR